jgi:hypothetical protein
MTPNVLHLNEAEINALRGLQAGVNQLDPRDPVWEELADLKLVERRILVAFHEPPFAYMTLTMRGRLYGTT